MLPPQAPVVLPSQNHEKMPEGWEEEVGERLGTQVCPDLFPFDWLSLPGRKWADVVKIPGKMGHRHRLLLAIQRMGFQQFLFFGFCL